MSITHIYATIKNNVLSWLYGLKKHTSIYVIYIYPRHKKSSNLAQVRWV